MAKRRTNLGSGRIYHAKGAREVYRYAMDGLQKAIDAANEGRCRTALDNFTIANQDFGSFFTEFKHAVGVARHGFTPMGAPRMRRALSAKRSDALSTLARKCLVK